ncbi:uncharacterized protein LOC135199397 [Macrobrachium nipponense]|uniref:uncharacterized protein LOC135199397 n=1 Tax=Macrobrachium nipponense TaxID=159736 RepID=UPI0030C8A5E4
MLTSAALTWLLLAICADFWMDTVAGSLVLEISLNVSETPSQSKIYFSRLSEDASFKLVLDNEEKTVEADNMEGWQELRFIVSLPGPECTSALTQTYNRYGYQVMEVCSKDTEDQLEIQVLDLANISLAIGEDPSKVIGDARNTLGKLQTDVPVCIAVVLILGLLCYSVYLLHDTRKMIKGQNECDHAASLCTLQNESKMTPARKFSTTSTRNLMMHKNSIRARMSTDSIDLKPLSPGSPKPPSDLPPPVPPTPDHLNYLAVSTEMLDSDYSSPMVPEQITEEDEEEHDYDYIDLKKLQQYKNQMKLVGQEIEERFAGQRLLHDSENSLYEPAKSSELNTFQNTVSGNSIYESLINLEIEEHVQQDEKKSTTEKSNSIAPNQEISLNTEENKDTVSEATFSPFTDYHQMLPQDSMRPENEGPSDILSISNLCRHESAVTLTENEYKNSLEDFTPNFQSLEELPLEAQIHKNEDGKEGSNEELIPVIQSQNDPEQGHKWDASDASFTEKPESQTDHPLVISSCSI